MDWVRDRRRSLAIVVSYFTDSFYQREAFELVRSCQRFSLDYHVQEVVSLGSWLQNTNYKPQFLLDMAIRYPERTIVWVDADARFRKRPDLFNIRSPLWDVSFRKIPSGKLCSGKCCSGTVILPSGSKREGLLKEWIHQIELHPESTDQVCLGFAMHRLQADRYELPVEYCWIFDFDEDGKTVEMDPAKYEPVVEHLQASRWVRHCPRCGT